MSGRRADKETGKQADKEFATLLVSLSPCLVATLLIWLSLLFLGGCALPGATPGPPPTPTPPLAPYNAAIATAEAGSDAKAQAAAYYERGNVQDRKSVV